MKWKNRIIVGTLVFSISFILLYFNNDVRIFVDDLFGICSVDKTICFAQESTFYPYPLIGLILLILILFIINRILGKISENRKFVKSFIEHEAILSVIGGIGVPIFGLFFPILLTVPLLDYNAQIVGNDLKINLLNTGLVSAKNVIVSLNVENSNVKFSEFKIKPILSTMNNNSLVKNEDSKFIILNWLPPTSQTLISTKLSNYNNNTQITIFIRADEWVAYHNLIPIGIIYVIIILSFGIILNLKYFSKFLDSIFSPAKERGSLDYYSRD